MINHRKFEMLHCDDRGVEDDNYEEHIVHRDAVADYQPETGIAVMGAGATCWHMKVNQPQRSEFTLWLEGGFDRSEGRPKFKRS